MFPFPKIYLYAGLAIACVGVFLYIRFLHARVDHWKGQYEEISAVLARERNAHRLESEQMKLELEQQKQQSKELDERMRRHYEDRIHANNAVNDSLRVELRRARADSGALKPASTAPATCRDYEADRTKLSERDQDILADFAKRCDAAAIQANQCSEYAVSLYQICTKQYESH